MNRPNADFRGFCGQVAAGVVRPDDKVMILPSRKTTQIARIVTHDGDLDIAKAGKAVTLTFRDEIDISRGDVIVSAQNPCEVANIFKTTILWTSEKQMISGRQYLFRSATVSAVSTLKRPDSRIDINSFERLSAKTLELNEIGICDITLNRSIAFEPYDINRNLGSFILIDRMTNETVAMGMIAHAMRRSENIYAQKITIDPSARAHIKGQKPCVIWMTGISGAGKSTIANIAEQLLHERGHHTILLDGDNIRRGLNRDLGFTEADRAENIRRVAEVAKLMTDAGLITIVSLISPFQADRRMACEIIGGDNFLEVYIDTPLEVAESHDVKGLYKKARAGEIPNFTGIGSPYEAPDVPDLRLDTTRHDAKSLAEALLHHLGEKGFIS